MNPVYWTALSLTVLALMVLAFMILTVIQAGKRGDEVNDADVAAPEGDLSWCFFDADDDRGERK
ncbi:hypothetical protein [Gellertiella hungarica]|uniref:Uncharacterized protein n=1 Tax=Gellertiella hungarica TaxID=1572859 RepID=A0A7W6NJV0_9HYPH|nr:hypothetical protein [Gellertiella hungarica]MBB4063652.1 hypothetical protein [Gellertiella hungarica]